MVAGVCVFDIDGTVTPNKHMKRVKKKNSKKAVLAMVNQCELNGYEVAINTARPRIKKSMRKYLSDVGIDLEELPQKAIQTGKTTSNKKVKALNSIKRVYGINDPTNVLFFDDRSHNINAANSAGYIGMQIIGGMISPENVATGTGYFTIMSTRTKHNENVFGTSIY